MSSVGISESGMVENVGVAAEIASPSLSVQKLFLLPVSSPPFLNSDSHHRRHPCSDVRDCQRQ